MEQWLEWARGPFFRASFAIMILGLLRVLAFNAFSMARLIIKSRKNKREIPWSTVVSETLKWMFPVQRGFNQRPVFSFTSILFHAGIIITPIFLGAHIVLWDRGLGISWPSISQAAADYLTILAVVTGMALFIFRVSSRSSRAISRFQDYFLPLLIIVPFITGYLAMHPSINPVSWHAAMFIHVMSGNLILVLLPFTKMSHVALFPTTQLVSELGWYLEPDSGENVMKELGKEGESI